MMDVGEKFDEDVSQNMMVHSSLAISPDLNALLEHDERTRGCSNQLDSTLSHFIQTQSSVDTAFPISLPPPPRSRKAGSRPTTPKGVSHRSARQPDATGPSLGSSSSLPSLAVTSNPFLNAPPKLPRFNGPNEREQHNGPISDMSSLLEMPDSLRKALNLVVDSPTSATTPEQIGDSHGSYTSPIQETSASLRPTDQPYNPPIVTYSMPRLDKLIGKGKSIFFMSGSHPQGNSQVVPDEEEQDSLELSRVAQRDKPRSFSEVSNQLGTSKYNCFFFSPTSSVDTHRRPSNQ